MDSLRETELYDAATGLGQWYKDELPEGKTKERYLANQDQCLECVKDLLIALKEPSAEVRMFVHMKLGEWKVLTEHLIPLFQYYRENMTLIRAVLEVMAMLTSRIRGPYELQEKHLEFLQNYKEGLAKKDVIIVLMRMLVENMEDEAEAQEEQRVGESSSAAASRKGTFESLVALLRNLVSTPDPLPGDRGFTPLRRELQVRYIAYFHDEGFLDFVLLWAEEAIGTDNVDQAWALLDVIYHICTHIGPEELCKDPKEKDKKKLGGLLERDQVLSKFRTVQSSRHSRFGTAMQNRSILGGSTISSSVYHNTAITKGGSVWRREFVDPKDRNEKKINMFHDPFFVDLEEGSVREHNRLNPHLRNALETAKDVSNMSRGLKKFFIDFLQTSFSSLVSLLRRQFTASAQRAIESGRFLREYDRPKILNFVSWVLEFSRYNFAEEQVQAKTSGGKDADPPIFDIAVIQGAIDLDMIQFVTARVREYGKESNIHASHLVIVLRALVQQLKTLNVASESQDSDTRDCGRILLQNIVKDDTMANLVWIMQNFKSSTHDPRIMSYVVEAFHHLTRLMAKVLEASSGQNIEFQVEKSRGTRTSRSTTTGEKEIAALADARVVENLFYLLEKYKRHSNQLHSMLVKLIYQIIKASPTNIVVFFELTYFTRIHRIVSDPVLQDRKEGKRYKEMMELLRYILRQFFKCAETNGCVFAELLFRKVPDKQALLESHTSEFAAILDNYENPEYRTILDRVEQGEAVRAARGPKAEVEKPWTAAEDSVLTAKFPIYEDHPLVAELLAAELPEESNRNARQVRKRLQELGMTRKPPQFGNGQAVNNQGGIPGDEAEDGAPPPKRQKVDGEDSETPAGIRLAEAESLEEEMERLLDAQFDAQGSLPPAAATDTVADTPAPATAGGISMAETGTFVGVSTSAAAAAPGMTPVDSQMSSQGVDLEKELEAMLEMDDPSTFPMPSMASRPPSVEPVIGAATPAAATSTPAGTAPTVAATSASATMMPPPPPPAAGGGGTSQPNAFASARNGGDGVSSGFPDALPPARLQGGLHGPHNSANEDDEDRSFWGAIGEAAPRADSASQVPHEGTLQSLDLEKMMEGSPRSEDVLPSQASSLGGLSQALERIMEDAPAPTNAGDATVTATPSQQTTLGEGLSQQLEIELEHIMDCATPIRRSSNVGLDGSSAALAASQASPDIGLSQNLEVELERIMEFGTPLRNGVSTETPQSNVKKAQADVLSQTLEKELENIMSD